MLESLLENDIALFLYLNNLGSVQWDGFWLFMTNKFSAIPLYLALIFMSYKKLGTKKTILAVIFILLLIAVSDQTSQLFKYGLKRLRPCHDGELMDLVRLVKSKCGGKYSFFSAHAANSAAIAVYFGLLLRPYYKYLFSAVLVWATVVAYSRIYIGVHFPADVLFGFFVGSTYGIVFYMLLQFFVRKFEKKLNV
ncbi:MAG: phosphatase PAP2 family protein [Flavobacteriaceae bacterium]|nr:MAG: phosphatase PAP2 family protein [Flavobacteriaceae bacterium]